MGQESVSAAGVHQYGRGMRPFARMAALALAVGLGLVVGAAPSALAHTDLVESTPADGSVLEVAPTEVTFTFSEDLLSGANAISVFDDAGNVLVKGSVESNGPVVRVALPATTPAGVLHAAYRVVSADGHPVTGEVTFTVRTAAGPTDAATTRSDAVSSGGPTGPPDATAAPATSVPADAQRAREEGRASANFSIVLGVVLVALAVALYIKRRRQAAGQ